MSLTKHKRLQHCPECEAKLLLLGWHYDSTHPPVALNWMNPDTENWHTLDSACNYVGIECDKLPHPFINVEVTV